MEELKEHTAHHRVKRFGGASAVKTSMQSLEEVTKLVKEPRNRLISDTVLPDGTRVMIVRGKFRNGEQVDYNDQGYDVGRRSYRIKIQPGQEFVVNWQGNKVIPDSLNTEIASNGQYSTYKIVTYIIRSDGSRQQVDYVPASSSAKVYHVVRITVFKSDGTQEEVPLELPGGKNIRVTSATRGPDGRIIIICQLRIRRRTPNGVVEYLDVDDDQPGSELTSVIVRPRPDGKYVTQSSVYVAPPEETAKENATPPPVILAVTAAPPPAPPKGGSGDEFVDIQTEQVLSPSRPRPRPTGAGPDDEFFDVTCNCYRYPDGSISYTLRPQGGTYPPRPQKNPDEEFYDIDCDCYRFPNGTIKSSRKDPYPSDWFIRKKTRGGREQIQPSDIARPTQPDDGNDISPAESGPPLDLYRAYKGINSKPVGQPIDIDYVSPASSGPPLPSPLPVLHRNDRAPQGNAPPRSDDFIRPKKPNGTQIQVNEIERPSRISGRPQGGAGGNVYDGSGGRITRPSNNYAQQQDDDGDYLRKKVARGK